MGEQRTKGDDVKCKKQKLILYKSGQLPAGKKVTIWKRDIFVRLEGTQELLRPSRASWENPIRKFRAMTLSHFNNNKIFDVNENFKP